MFCNLCQLFFREVVCCIELCCIGCIRESDPDNVAVVHLSVWKICGSPLQEKDLIAVDGFGFRMHNATVDRL